MEDEKSKVEKLQTKSHELLLKMLNNIGIVGAILAAVADIIFVIIMVLGVEIHSEPGATAIFAVINACIGVLISVLLRYQGQRYGEIENQELCKKYYNKTAREKKRLPMSYWSALKALQDIVVKGGSAAFSIFGVIYISIEGSKNPIQILITIGTLVLFACFGLMAMYSAYNRFYNVQVPMMELKVQEKCKNIFSQTGEKEQSDDQN